MGTDTQRKPRLSAFSVVIGIFLLLLALAAIYFGLSEPLQLWPHQVQAVPLVRADHA